MITVTVQNHSHFATLTFPCSENELEKKLEELDRWDETNFTLFVDKVSEPEELSVLQDRFIDLDEVNYLAKRMDSFDRNEKKQFFAAASQCGFMQVKDLINLTFNLSRFTLVQDLSSMESVGRLHQLTLSGGLGEEDMEPEVFAEIGRELLESGRGKITEYGILFVNEEIPFDEVYDGQVFPEYYYEKCLCTAMIEVGDKTEYAYLPCDEKAIEKAFRRLGSSDFSYDRVLLVNSEVNGRTWDSRLQAVLEDEGLFLVNELLGAVNRFQTQEEWDKLSAMAELAGVSDSKSLMKLAEYTNGVFGFEDVPFGDWVIRELKPAEGFLPNSENYPVAIAGDGQVVEIIVVNDRIPELGTTATVDGEKEINATEVFTLEDVVSYKHLIPGKEYVVNGVLMDKNTEKPLIIDRQEVHSEAVFTPEQPTGEVVVSFTFDAKFIKEDTSIVVFESLYKDGMELAVHADIEDENQTVKVRVPKIRTKATIDGKKKAEADKELTIVDTVTYKNLTPGKEYLVEGILMDKKTGKPYLVDGKEIRSEAAFVPEKKNGKIEIAFTFDGSGIKKDTDIVVFETLYRDMVELTAHADIEDKGQTVTIIPPAPIVPQTGDSSMTGLWLGLGAIALGGLISLLFIKKKKDEDYES